MKIPVHPCGPKQGHEREVETFARHVTLENCTLERSGKFMWDYGYLWQITVWPEDYNDAERAMAAKYFRHDLVRGPVRMKAGDELDIIREGQVINLVRPGPGHVYASKGAAVEVRDPRKVFVVDAKLGAAFVLKARLRIERPNDAWLAFPAVRHPGDSARGGTFTPEELVGTRAPGSCC